LDRPAAYYCGEFFQALEESGELRKGESVGAVGEGFSRAVVSFEEDAVYACGYAGAGQRLDELRLPAAGVALAAGDLDRMSYVEDYGIA
jgi:hypothetical protein